MKIGIIGAGHIGTALYCFIRKNRPEIDITLFTRNPDQIESEIICNDWEKKQVYSVPVDKATSYYPKARDLDLIYITLPSFARETAFSCLASYVKDNVMIGVMPGCGGCEFFFSKYFHNDATLFGFQRVPFTAKLVKKGHEVNLKSWKSNVAVATLKQDRLPDVCASVNRTGLLAVPVGNYLAVTLTPTNPVLHTSRMFDLLLDTKSDHVFKSKQKFYVGWSDRASSTMLGIDGELHDLIKSMGDSFDLSAVKPLSVHYEASSVSAMTKKINSIPTFQTVYAPMIAVEHGYVMDKTSRMFTEDFPWGLALIKAFCEIYDVSCPTVDKVLNWFCDYTGKQYFLNGRFEGVDLIETGIPQNYNIMTPGDVENLYLN